MEPRHKPHGQTDRPVHGDCALRRHIRTRARLHKHGETAEPTHECRSRIARHHTGELGLIMVIEPAYVEVLGVLLPYTGLGPLRALKVQSRGKPIRMLVYLSTN